MATIAANPKGSYLRWIDARLTGSASFFFPRRKTDGPFFLHFQRGHQFADGIENRSEFDVVFLFQRDQFAR